MTSTVQKRGVMCANIPKVSLVFLGYVSALCMQLHFASYCFSWFGGASSFFFVFLLLLVMSGSIMHIDGNSHIL